LAGGIFYFYQNQQKINAPKGISGKQLYNDDISSLAQKMETEENPEKYKEYIYQLIKFENKGVEALKEIIKTTNNELLIDDILEILAKEKIMSENEAMGFIIKTRPDLILRASDELLKQTRDAQRISNLEALKATINLYLNLVGKPFTNCIAGKEYSSNKGTNAVDGTGWLPLDFTKISGGSPLMELSVDPQNTEGFIYRFACDPQNLTFEFNAKMESDEYKKMASDDGGDNPNIYEIGTSLNLIY